MNEGAQETERSSAGGRGRERSARRPLLHEIVSIHLLSRPRGPALHVAEVGIQCSSGAETLSQLEISNYVT